MISIVHCGVHHYKRAILNLLTANKLTECKCNSTVQFIKLPFKTAIDLSKNKLSDGNKVFVDTLI